MKIVRTFHPIGQGAFYSERFYEKGNSQAKYNIVYDCGTSWGTITKAKKVVSQAFDKNDTIDYLFVSHLDYDHVSLVNTLIESVAGKVQNIVLPLVHKDEVRIGINLNYIANHLETVNFLRMALRFIDDRDIGLDTGIEFVDNNEFNGRFMVGGKNIPLRIEKDEPDWVLIPRNVSARARRKELLDSLDKMLADTDFREMSSKYGLPDVGSSEELMRKLLDEEYVADIVREKKLRNAIKSAYEKVAGGVNENSLLLYSGPAETNAHFKMWSGLPLEFRNWIYRRVACLYTGDSNFDINEWKDNLYTTVWDNIGTIQLPHHGSLKSFDVSKNDLDRTYFFPVSCGGVNSYGHPSGKVLAYLTTRDCLPQIVTEMANTVFMQSIMR